MRWLERLLAFMLMAVVVGCASFNSYRETGSLALGQLQAPVKVVRDEKGMPYIHAHSLGDAFLAMGFVTAQDRLFQMELTRLVAAGRISELAGERALPLDRRMRTIGIRRLAERHARLLQDDATILLRKYRDGVNAFVEGCQQDHHLEFQFSGLQPTPWTLTDVLSVMYYMSWNSSANIKTEILAQMLIDRLGLEKAQEIFPLNINPDANHGPDRVRRPSVVSHGKCEPVAFQSLWGYLEDNSLTVGSNNWVAGPALSPSAKPILANDPHLDARILPGPFYPCGLLTPELRIVGAHIPGFPIMPIFRNGALAAGVTNAYADVQDLYIETCDPADDRRYMEGMRSMPFEVIEETLRIKDDGAPGGFREEKLTIRITHRGPVISGIFSRLQTDKVITLRWAAAESIMPDSDFSRIMQAKSAPAFREALRAWNAIPLNFVFADDSGQIGWHVSGRLPRRSPDCGTVPTVVRDARDNWTGWIPFEAMPQVSNPAKGWVGTSNQKTVGADYPYYYSSYAASSYRYRRLKQLMADHRPITVDDHWRYQRDTGNVLAQAMVPLMIPVLTAHADTREMGAILSAWNGHDDGHLVAPTLFHAIYNHWAWRVFQDELGETLARSMLSVWYFWQERFQALVEEGQSPWFDDIHTVDVRETMQDCLYQAARDARDDLRLRLGQDMRQWQWERVHTIDFVSPIRREGLGRRLLGGGTHPMSGSGETLLRGRYDFNQPYAVCLPAALRMVADLNDAHKVVAVLPGGVSGRVFHPHAKDQVRSFMNGEKQYWWFSDEEIRAHARTELVLHP